VRITDSKVAIAAIACIARIVGRTSWDFVLFAISIIVLCLVTTAHTEGIISY